MAVTKETLKKHHFWILVGLTPLLVLIAIISIDVGVGGATDAKNAAIKKETDALQGKDNPKSEVLISRFGEQIEELGKKRTDLWKDNWERQIGLTTKKVNGKDVLVQDPSRNLLRWPNSKLLNRFNYTVDYATNKKDQLKFGDRIPDELNEEAEFKKPEVYLAEFSNPYLKDAAREIEKRTGMADRIYPTAFAGNGWNSVLRHVNNWGEGKPTSEQLWLALEDIWVQRAMLDAVKTVNDQIGTFSRANLYANGMKVEDSLLERAFESRIWYLSLKVSEQPATKRFVITGTLRNQTDRLQLLGAGNTMVLNVWLSKAPNAQPIPFKIGGEFVAGGATMLIAPSDDHVLPAGTTVEEIARVEQVFDAKTVPIRRIDHLALGYRDSRYAALPLQMPNFASFKKEAETAATSAATTGGTDALGGGGAPPGAGSGSGKPGTPGAPGSSGGSEAAGVLEGGGSVAAVLDGNRKRYIDVPTAQIRRMPVAITVIVDQAYMQDVLVAYANLPMRFQIMQFHWQRFRGTLGGGGSSGGSPAGGGSSGGEGELGGAAKRYEGSSSSPVSGFGSSGYGPPPGIGPKPGGPGPMGPPMPGSGSPMGPPGFGSGGFAGFAGFAGSGGSGASSFSESQLSAGLVEITIYGIVSLYEKYEAPDVPPAQ